MGEDTVVTLCSFTNEMQAEIARMTLDAHGISSIISRDDCGGMEPYLQPGLGVRLLVHSANAEAAIEILESTDEEEAESITT